MTTLRRDARGAQRLLYGVAALFVMSSVFHLGVYALSGGGWAGSVSWRKPIEFSLSFFIATATFGWILGLLPSRRMQDWAFAIVYSVSSLGEVALIVLQRWRGTASCGRSPIQADGAPPARRSRRAARRAPAGAAGSSPWRSNPARAR